MSTESLTMAEGVISTLIGMGRLDETNPRLIRQYAQKAVEVNAVETLNDFYLKEFPIDEYSEYTALDKRIGMIGL